MAAATRPQPTGVSLRFVLLEQPQGRVPRWTEAVERLCSPVDGFATGGRVLYDCAASA